MRRALPVILLGLAVTAGALASAEPLPTREVLCGTTPTLITRRSLSVGLEFVNQGPKRVSISQSSAADGGPPLYPDAGPADAQGVAVDLMPGGRMSVPAGSSISFWCVAATAQLHAAALVVNESALGTPTGTSSTPPLFPPCRTQATSPDAGTDWCTILPALTSYRLGTLSADLSYRIGFLPDGGAAAYNTDVPLSAGGAERGTLTRADSLPDAGVPICIHLSAADPAAGVATCQ